MRRNNRNNTGRAEVEINGEAVTVEVVRHSDKNSRIRRLGGGENDTYLVETSKLKNYRKESSDNVIDPSQLDSALVGAGVPQQDRRSMEEAREQGRQPIAQRTPEMDESHHGQGPHRDEVDREEVQRFGPDEAAHRAEARQERHHADERQG